MDWATLVLLYNLSRTLHKLPITSEAIIDIGLPARDNFALWSNSRCLICIFIWHIWHVLLNWSKHGHIILILLICHSMCSILHVVTYFDASRARVLIPAFLVNHCIIWHGHRHASELIHIKPNCSDVALWNGYFILYSFLVILLLLLLILSQWAPHKVWLIHVRLIWSRACIR